MIQEPPTDLTNFVKEFGHLENLEDLADLSNILEEPVCQISAQMPALRKRLTVRLVALDPSSPVVQMPEASLKEHGTSIVPVAEADYTPGPESYSYDESDEDEDWFFSCDETPVANWYTPSPEPGPYTPPVDRLRQSDPALPLFSPDLAYFGESYQSNGSVALVVSGNTSLLALPAPSAPPWHLDTTLLVLTVLLLLGILGGIGFGYMLTLIVQA